MEVMGFSPLLLCLPFLATLIIEIHNFLNTRTKNFNLYSIQDIYLDSAFKPVKYFYILKKMHNQSILEKNKTCTDLDKTVTEHLSGKITALNTLTSLSIWNL